jgi:tRNA uridine 5-carbamoylmethylation protein Kti12
VFAVVLTGPPGAGKTSVLTALVDALSDDDIAHAAVEVETLVWTHPALTDEQWARHVRSACELYRAALELRRGGDLVYEFAEASGITIVT